MSKMILTPEERQDALKAKIHEKFASMSEEEVAAFVAEAEAEKIASQTSGDSQAGGRISYHGFDDCRRVFQAALEKNAGDKAAALRDTAEWVDSIDEHFVALSTSQKTASVAADALTNEDVDGLAKIASNEDLPDEVRKVAHDTLVRHGYELREE